MDEETRALAARWLAGAAAVSSRVEELALELPPSIDYRDRSAAAAPTREPAQ